MHSSDDAYQPDANHHTKQQQATSADQRPLANQIVSASSRFARVVTQVANIEISAVSMRALGYIERHGPQRISHMASYESISQPAMTSAVNRLADGGLVVRAPDPADARAQLVELTDQGQRMLDEYRSQVATVLQPMLENFSAADYAVIEHAVELLETLANDLTGNA